MKQKRFTRLLALVIVALLALSVVPTALAGGSEGAGPAPELHDAQYDASTGSLSGVLTTPEENPSIVETFILTDQELASAIGNLTISNVVYYILGINTNETSQSNISMDPDGNGGTKIGINNSVQYFGENQPPQEGDTFFIAVQTENGGNLSQVSTPQRVTVENGIARFTGSSEPITQEGSSCNHASWAKIPTYTGDLARHRIVCAHCGAAWGWEGHVWHEVKDDNGSHFACMCGASTASMTTEQRAELENYLRGLTPEEAAVPVEEQQPAEETKPEETKQEETKPETQQEVAKQQETEQVTIPADSIPSEGVMTQEEYDRIEADRSCYCTNPNTGEKTRCD